MKLIVIDCCSGTEAIQQMKLNTHWGKEGISLLTKLAQVNVLIYNEVDRKKVLDSGTEEVADEKKWDSKRKASFRSTRSVCDFANAQSDKKNPALYYCVEFISLFQTPSSSETNSGLN